MLDKRKNKMMGRLVCAVVLFCVVTAIASPAQTFTTLVDFNVNTGETPSIPVQGSDGNLYGTTATHGGNGLGTAFKTTPLGDLTTLYNFCSETNCADGGLPDGLPLTLGTNGNLYGGTQTWGANGAGTIFSMTEAGQLTTLYNFGQLNGPTSLDTSLVQMSDGSFYATSAEGGTNCEIHGFTGCGTLFKMSSAGVVTTLHSFCAHLQKNLNCLDGQSPANLLLATNGHLYGTTRLGGKFEGGTIFDITPTGQFAILYNFCSQPNCSDGGGPASLFQGTDGNLYGTTTFGGTNIDGTVFRLTTAGTLTTLYTFCPLTGCVDGYQPNLLIEASDGNLYGVTVRGGAHSEGTVFQLTIAGHLTTLHNFAGSDGALPIGLIQGTDGSFYGATANGGSSDAGTLFNLSTGIGPFVKFVRGFGKIGQNGGILGQGFTGTTSVLFNGTPANFTVVSDTYIQATVPSGATKGYVTVDTPSGRLKSNVPFRVIP